MSASKTHSTMTQKNRPYFPNRRDVLCGTSSSSSCWERGKTPYFDQIDRLLGFAAAGLALRAAEKSTYFGEIGALSSALLSGTVGRKLLVVAPVRPHFCQVWCGPMVLGGGDLSWQQAGQAAEAQFPLRPFQFAPKCAYKVKDRCQPPTRPTQDNGVASHVCAQAEGILSSTHPPHPRQWRSKCVTSICISGKPIRKG